MEIIDLIGNKIKVEKCLGCDISNEKIKVLGGILYSDEDFVITQDIELPINGFIIISTKAHYEKLSEISQNAQLKLISLINKTIKILENNHIAEEYNIILEEKKGYHFHVWLMPRHKWMIEKFGKVLKNIKQIQEYAINNLKTQENINLIKSTCDLLKNKLNSNN